MINPLLHRPLQGNGLVITADNNENFIGIQNADIPLVQTLTFIFAVLIVLFNLVADVLYGLLDPRIRYD